MNLLYRMDGRPDAWNASVPRPQAGRPDAPGGKRQCPARRAAVMALAFLVPLLAVRPLYGAEPKVKTVPLYRLVEKERGCQPTHLYTTNAVERDSLSVQSEYYKYECIAGYVLPASAPPMPDTVPFYRLAKVNFKNQAIGATDHFCTADSAEMEQAIRDGWTAKGVMCRIASRQLPGTLPVYRLQKTFKSEYGTVLNNEHFYTIDEAEYFNAIHRLGYVGEGLSGYIWTAEVEVSVGKPAIPVTRKTGIRKP